MLLQTEQRLAAEPLHPPQVFDAAERPVPVPPLDDPLRLGFADSRQ
jgi:hypothetical protein